MIIKTDDYIIDANILNTIIISGSMRLPSSDSYEEPFALIKDGLDTSTDTLIINIKELEYLNSSGITSLATIILQAKNNDKPLKLIINKNIPWQHKTLLSLKNLWEKLSIETN